MEKNFKLVIEYDGTAYHGWQRQKSVSTIQETIEQAISKITNREVTLHGSGRTDSGVHAWNQVANFSVATSLSCDALQRGLDSLTPDDIVIKSCESVPMPFHARFDAVSKIYEYIILNRAHPKAIARQFAWHVRAPLDVDAMNAGAAQLEGTHDFAAFEASGSPRNHTVRTVTRAFFVRDTAKDQVVFTIEANGFLRCMVRNIVGTLVDLGLGRMTLENFQEIFLSKDRSRAGATAPPHGLFLKEVLY
jgi:tRNA pseudouridine38-40 synthase